MLWEPEIGCELIQGLCWWHVQGDEIGEVASEIKERAKVLFQLEPVMSLLLEAACGTQGLGGRSCQLRASLDPNEAQVFFSSAVFHSRGPATHFDWVMGTLSGTRVTSASLRLRDVQEDICLNSV